MLVFSKYFPGRDLKKYFLLQNNYMNIRHQVAKGCEGIGGASLSLEDVEETVAREDIEPLHLPSQWAESSSESEQDSDDEDTTKVKALPPKKSESFFF